MMQQLDRAQSSPLPMVLFIVDIDNLTFLKLREILVELDIDLEGLHPCVLTRRGRRALRCVLKLAVQVWLPCLHAAPCSLGCCSSP
jgi:hypothetical protein